MNQDTRDAVTQQVNSLSYMLDAAYAQAYEAAKRCPGQHGCHSWLCTVRDRLAGAREALPMVYTHLGR